MSFNISNFNKSSITKLATDRLKSFNIKKFGNDEYDVLGGQFSSLTENIIDMAGNQVNKFVAEGTSKLTRAVNKKLDEISLQQRPQVWHGHTVQDAKELYASLYDLRQILSSNYFVNFEAYENNATLNAPIFDDDLTGYLATETNLPILDAEFEAVQIGAFQENHLVGFNNTDIQMTFLETGGYRILNSMLHIKDLMVNSDGTINPPASYAMWLSVGVFSREYGLSNTFDRRFLVAPTLASVEALTAEGVSEVMKVPVTWKVLRNFME